MYMKFNWGLIQKLSRNPFRFILSMAGPHHPQLFDSNTYKHRMMVLNLDRNVSFPVIAVIASLHGLLASLYWDGGI